MYVFMYIVVANKPPTTRQLLSFVIPKVATRWYELGVMLLRPEQEPRLQQIKSDHGDNVRKSCLEMFTYWRRSHPDDNWNHLVAALKSPGLEMDAVAADLQKMFTGKLLILWSLFYSMCCTCRDNVNMCLCFLAFIRI